ncbi:MAG: DUF368 domain-containing protein [Bacilli bacterium]|nr:DUF368 domain-containing protein [Bacilli bacterium]
MMIVNFIRGFCMALADSVPGVSGGTIAFLLGFYDKFINSLNSLIKGNKIERIGSSIKFLLKLGLGWIVGMILSSSILSIMFDKYIYNISSLFIGFIILSIPIMIIEEKESLKGKYQNIIFMIIGIIVVILLSVLKLSNTLDISNITIFMGVYIFIAGMLAISAMVLPGISGSTLLLTFGLYIPIINSIKNLLHFNFQGFPLLMIFGFGVLAGIFVSLKLIKKLLDTKRSATIYAVIGMMIGSIYAIINGPTTLKTPQHMMGLNDFNIIFFIIGVVIVIGLQKIKNLSWYKKESR